MRILGPNCIGLVNTHTAINTSFALDMPHRGSIAFVSQSGAMCVAMSDWAAIHHVGFSALISYGNAGDITESDLLDYLFRDPKTKVIVCYLEGIHDGRRFLETARIATQKKPILIIKGGMTERGAQAALSHTGSLTGTSTVYC